MSPVADWGCQSQRFPIESIEDALSGQVEILWRLTPFLPWWCQQHYYYLFHCFYCDFHCVKFSGVLKYSYSVLFPVIHANLETVFWSHFSKATLLPFLFSLIGKPSTFLERKMKNLYLSNIFYLISSGKGRIEWPYND